MSTLPQSEIKALVKLLKTDDESTYRLLREQLKTFDNRVLKDIEVEISINDVSLKQHFLELVTKVKREELKASFLKLDFRQLSNLEKGVFLISLFNNPFLDINYYIQILDGWSQALSKNLKQIKLPDDATSVINEVNHFLFMELGFQGNKQNYYDPENSYIDKVIDKKLGNPILLSMIYIFVTRRLGLPFSGVNIPAHFLVQYVDSFEPVFVDPFNQGEIITRIVCQERIKALDLMWHESYLDVPTNKQILVRIMHNLINIYKDGGKLEEKECLEEYVRILK